jgi:phage-related holin
MYVDIFICINEFKCVYLLYIYISRILIHIYTHIVHGKLADLCRPIQKKYAQAVAVTAGKQMDAIVVDTKHVATECNIKYFFMCIYIAYISIHIFSGCNSLNHPHYDISMPLLIYIRRYFLPQRSKSRHVHVPALG